MVATIRDHHGSGSTIWGRSIGAAVMSIAGIWWGWTPVACVPVSPAITHTILVTTALMLFAAAANAIRCYRGPVVPVDRRLMTVSIVLEVPAIVVGTSLVASLGRPDLALPIIGLVVGLHFLPLARALSYPPYRFLGLAITIFALISMVLPRPAGLTILGAGISASLLLSSLYMTFRLNTQARGVTDPLRTA